MTHSRYSVIILFPLAVLSLGDYYWPSPLYDTLEALAYEGRRSDGSSLSALVHPCKNRTDTHASIGAEWLRFAFHDVATHNVSNGLGGLDGSIVYELDRKENFGAGFTSTLSDFQAYPNKYVSRADIIALGAIFGVSSCGGPAVPFRGGRIDVWSAGPSGVPQPQDSLQLFSETFSRMGFTQSEMIQLVACGHTLGTVRSTDFPTLVPSNSSSSLPVLEYFDGTSYFDNNIVTQYLDGSTKNPLVVGPDQNLSSDLRVFSSDSNTTMKRMAGSDSFSSTCNAMIGRMLNIIPINVTLTNEIALLPVKVRSAQMTFERGKLVLKTSFRLSKSLSTPLNKPSSVKMLWCDKYGSNQDCIGLTRSSVAVSNLTETNLSPLMEAQNVSFTTYNFVVLVDSSASVSKFWFEVDEHNGKSLYDNAGKGYVLQQDQVLFVPTLSQATFQTDNSNSDSRLRLRGGAAATSLTKQYFIVAAVRNGSNPLRVYMDAYDFAFTNFTTSLNVTVDLHINSSIEAMQGYTFYTGQVVDTGLQMTVDIHCVLPDGTIYSDDFKETLDLDNTLYLAPMKATNVPSKSSSSTSWKFLDINKVLRFAIVTILGSIILII